MKQIVILENRGAVLASKALHTAQVRGNFSSLPLGVPKIQ